MLVVGLAFSLDSEMAAGLLYVICVPGGGLGYLVATLRKSSASSAISATVNLMSTYLVIRMISFQHYLLMFVGFLVCQFLCRTLFANLIGSTKKTSKENYLHLQYQYLDNTQQIPFSDAEYRFLNLS